MSFYLYSINTGFYIKSDGYVGILNSNPQHALDISGSCKATNFIGDSISGRIISGDTLFTQNFIVTTFSATTFTGKNFSGQNFTGNSFTGKNFYGGNFSGENIYAEHLIGVSQDGSFLECAPSYTGYYLNGSHYWNCFIQGTDLAGKITYGGVDADHDTPGSIDITGYFKKPYPFEPYVVISPVSEAAAYHSTGVYCYSNANHFVLKIKPILTRQQAYVWSYIVVGVK